MQRDVCGCAERSAVASRLNSAPLERSRNLKWRAICPTLAWVRWSIVPAVAFIALCLDRGYQSDFWQHLARGMQIVADGHVLHHDPFSFLTTNLLIRDANWLTQVMYWRAYSVGGLELVQVANALIVALTLLVLIRHAHRKCKSLAAAMLAGAIAFLGLWQMLLIRPQTLSLLLFALLHQQLDGKPGRRLLILVAAVMALWCNLHGGFAIGLVLVGACCFSDMVDSRVQRQSIPAWPIVTLALGFAGTLFNPWGIEIYRVSSEIAFRASSRGIEEWLPPTMGSLAGQILFLSIVLIVALSIKTRRKPGIREACLAIFFLPLAFHSTRMIAWWLLAMTPTLADLIARIVTEKHSARDLRPSWMAAAVMLLLGAEVALSVPWMERYNPVMGTLRSGHRIESDVEAAAAHIPPGSRVFTRLEWGGRLDCVLGPQNSVCMDGWIELYSDPQWHDFQTVSAGQPGWQKILDRWRVNQLLLDKSYHAQLLAKVRESGQWEQRFASGPAILLVRRKALQS